MTDELKTNRKTSRLVLEDIELSDVENQGVFKQYRPEPEVGEEILKEFMSARYSKRKAAQGFYLTEENKSEIGLITQCNGLMTVATLKTFGASLVPYVDQILDATTFILDMTDGGNYQPTPYLLQITAEEDVEEESFIQKYVDTIASVLSTLVLVREILYDKEINDMIADHSIIKRVEDRIIECIRELNAAAIKHREPRPYIINGDVMKNIVTGNDKIIYKGWNFAPSPDTEDASDYEMSLYFTYVVTNAYMDLKNTIDDAVVVHRDKVRKTNRISDEQLRELNLSDKFRRDYEFLESFSKDFDKFNEICVDVGHTIDEKISSNEFDITENFIGVKFTPTKLDDMLSSTTNDALFNTLEALGIVINAGIDLDYEDHSMMKYGDIRERLEYIEKLQYCLQNIQKCYKKMSQMNKEYVVDQYVLSFNENMPVSLIPQAKVLRKQRISPFALTPLTIKIYNLISKFLIRYPQKQSVTYLKTILENRMESTKYKWSWDLDGYNVIINYMYVDVLKDFYDYYNEFELTYSGNVPEKVRQVEEEYKEKISNIEKSYESKLQDIRDQSESLKSENEALRSKREPLIQELELLIRDEVRKQFEKNIIECFEQISEDNISRESSNLSKAFNNAFICWYADIFKDIEFMDEMSTGNRTVKNELRKSLLEDALAGVQVYLKARKE